MPDNTMNALEISSPELSLIRKITTMMTFAALLLGFGFLISLAPLLMGFSRTEESSNQQPGRIFRRTYTDYTDAESIGFDTENSFPITETLFTSLCIITTISAIYVAQKKEKSYRLVNISLPEPPQNLQTLPPDLSLLTTFSRIPGKHYPLRNNPTYGQIAQQILKWVSLPGIALSVVAMDFLSTSINVRFSAAFAASITDGVWLVIFGIIDTFNQNFSLTLDSALDIPPSLISFASSLRGITTGNLVGKYAMHPAEKIIFWSGLAGAVYILYKSIFSASEMSEGTAVSFSHALCRFSEDFANKVPVNWIAFSITGSFSILASISVLRMLNNYMIGNYKAEIGKKIIRPLLAALESNAYNSTQTDTITISEVLKNSLQCGQSSTHVPANRYLLFVLRSGIIVMISAFGIAFFHSGLIPPDREGIPQDICDLSSTGEEEGFAGWGRFDKALALFTMREWIFIPAGWLAAEPLILLFRDHIPAALKSMMERGRSLFWGKTSNQERISLLPVGEEIKALAKNTLEKIGALLTLFSIIPAGGFSSAGMNMTYTLDVAIPSPHPVIKNMLAILIGATASLPLNVRAMLSLVTRFSLWLTRDKLSGSLKKDIMNSIKYHVSMSDIQLADAYTTTTENYLLDEAGFKRKFPINSLNRNDIPTIFEFLSDIQEAVHEIQADRYLSLEFIQRIIACLFVINNNAETYSANNDCYEETREDINNNSPGWLSWPAFFGQNAFEAAVARTSAESSISQPVEMPTFS
ncbi:MAG: hypothetical protein K0R12_128 [Gammaproteobacteria bacterium]|jgi:hypothetical protein|nr:hypothetical protein [Gammaproteobacteria bacterium]